MGDLEKWGMVVGCFALLPLPYDEQKGEAKETVVSQNIHLV